MALDFCRAKGNRVLVWEQGNKMGAKGAPSHGAKDLNPYMFTRPREDGKAAFTGYSVREAACKRQPLSKDKAQLLSRKPRTVLLQRRKKKSKRCSPKTIPQHGQKKVWNTKKWPQERPQEHGQGRFSHTVKSEPCTGRRLSLTSPSNLEDPKAGGGGVGRFNTNQ